MRRLRVREVEYILKVIELVAGCAPEPRNPKYYFNKATLLSLAFPFIIFFLAQSLGMSQ